METTTRSTDLFPQQKKELPGMLNVLTILTFIGCALSYLGAIWGYIDSSNYEEKRAETEKLLDEAGENQMVAKMLEGSLDIMQRSHEHRYILLLSGLLFTTLCLIGAMQMRKLKKSGYTLYLIGELVPIIIFAALVGFSIAGGIMIIFSAVIALVFVILYTTQRKHLVN
jgi:hypothetical protein